MQIHQQSDGSKVALTKRLGAIGMSKVYQIVEVYAAITEWKGRFEHPS